MSALANDQRFVLLLIVGLISGTWLSIGTTAQTFTSEDRGSILKFMDVLLNFLDAESENATSTENPTNNGTTTESVESTTLSANATTSESTTASNATESSTVSSESTEATSNSTTTLATNATETSSSTETTSSTTVTTVASTPRRICFKRVCYKFASDKGYIY